MVALDLKEISHIAGDILMVDLQSADDLSSWIMHLKDHPVQAVAMFHHMDSPVKERCFNIHVSWDPYAFMNIRHTLCC